MQKLGISNNNTYYNPQFLQNNNVSQKSLESSKPNQDKDTENKHTVAKVALAVGVLTAAGICLYLCKGNAAKAKPSKSLDSASAKESQKSKAEIDESTKKLKITELDEKIKKLKAQSACALDWPWKTRKPSQEQGEFLVNRKKELDKKIEDLEALRTAVVSKNEKEVIALETNMLKKWKTIAEDTVNKLQAERLNKQPEIDKLDKKIRPLEALEKDETLTHEQNDELVDLRFKKAVIGYKGSLIDAKAELAEINRRLAELT